MILAGLGLAAALVATVPAPRGGGEPAAWHNKHLSHARVVLEGTTIAARIRLFRDDLEKAIGRKVTDDSASQAAVTTYVNRQFALRADGTLLAGEALEQGADMEGDQPVWWVLLQWNVPTAPRRLGFRDHLFFDQFTDQQNLLVFSRMPQDDRRTLYFQPGDRGEQVISW
ncbi:MAG: DUF6702 family protein [Gemmatimonadales bacterium]